MHAFLSPSQEVELYFSRISKQEEDREEYFYNQMYIYSIEAEKKLRRDLVKGVNSYEYATSVAYAFVDDYAFARDIFKRHELTPMHAYALLENFEWFKEDFEKLIYDNKLAQYE